MILRARPSAAVAVLGWLLFSSSTARAQDAKADAFSLQNFRPAVDSKGYVTVNASQILGHLDFSFGLVGNYAHDVLNLQRETNGFKSRFDVEHFLTPQLQGA